MFLVGAKILVIGEVQCSMDREKHHTISKSLTNISQEGGKERLEIGKATKASIMCDLYNV